VTDSCLHIRHLAAETGRFGRCWATTRPPRFGGHPGSSFSYQDGGTYLGTDALHSSERGIETTVGEGGKNGRAGWGNDGMRGRVYERPSLSFGSVPIFCLAITFKSLSFESVCPNVMLPAKMTKTPPNAASGLPNHPTTSAARAPRAIIHVATFLVRYSFPIRSFLFSGSRASFTKRSSFRLAIPRLVISAFFTEQLGLRRYSVRSTCWLGVSMLSSNQPEPCRWPVDQICSLARP